MMNLQGKVKMRYSPELKMTQKMSMIMGIANRLSRMRMRMNGRMTMRTCLMMSLAQKMVKMRMKTLALESFRSTVLIYILPGRIVLPCIDVA
jgi:hypothetical protein